MPRDGMSRWNASEIGLAGRTLMVAPAIAGIDLFKIAGRSISGWIPSFKTGAASHVRQPFCSQLEERLLPNRAMTLFTPLGPSADCRGPTQVTTYQGRTDNARVAAFSVS